MLPFAIPEALSTPTRILSASTTRWRSMGRFATRSGGWEARSRGGSSPRDPRARHFQSDIGPSLDVQKLVYDTFLSG
jgi:hypothetical protein